jgi:hypothetical protein
MVVTPDTLPVEKTWTIPYSPLMGLVNTLLSSIVVSDRRLSLVVISNTCEILARLGSSIPIQFSGAAVCVGHFLAEATVAEAFPGELLFLVDPVIVAQLMDPFACAQIEPEDVTRETFHMSKSLRVW